MMRSNLCLTLAIGAALSGCAAIESTPSEHPSDGLVYYMPKKDVMVTVVRDDSKTTVTIASTSAYADLERPYVLNFRRNLIGKNELNVGVSSSGLLTSTTSTTTSSFGEALKNLASSLGSVKGLSALPTTPATTCPAGTFTHVYSVSDPAIVDAMQPCGLTVTISRVAKSKYSLDVVDALTPPKAQGKGSAGVFYRQEEPYRVQVIGRPGHHPVNTSLTVLSPSQSPVRFLPIEQTLFASNKADFSFADGVLTKYDQNADGELIGLLKLPADVIGAYFAAIGNVLGSRKDNSAKEAEVLNANLQLEIAKKKYDACIEAISKNDDALIQQLECGK